MKILFIAPDIGLSAPGIVFEKLIREISKYNDVHVLTAATKNDNGLNQSYQTINYKRRDLNFRPFAYTIGLLGVHPYDLYVAFRAAIKATGILSEKIDVVVSMICNHNYVPLIAGRMISKQAGCKHAVHSVDAIPPPGWPGNKLYYNGVKRLVKKYLKNIDGFFTTNNQMLNYQLTTFEPKKEIVTADIYNSIDREFTYLPESREDSFNFVYTGKIYGLRNPSYLLHAFEKLLKKFPNARLIFIGTWRNGKSFPELNANTEKNIDILPHQDELTKFYKEATALIDIDIEMEGDVFMSSKIVNYLPFNRIIISQTGANSPSREIFRNISSIFQCDHNADQLYHAMVKAILEKDQMGYADRADIAQEFNVENVARKLHELLDEMYNG